MHKLVALAFAAGIVGTAVPSIAQVSISVGIHQPGAYGRIGIGDLPPAALVLPQPVIIDRPRVALRPAPVYLYVPTEYQRNWRRYCGHYQACGRPVYFVRDEWVRERYEHEHPGWDHGRHRGREDHDEDHDDGHGRGKGRGHGHGNGHGHGHR